MPTFPNLQSYISELKARKEEFLKERTNTRLKIILDLKALIALRIQTTGRNYDDEAFAPYSPDYQKRKEKDFENARSGIVDFTVTGNLWRNLKATVTEESDDRIVVSLQADNDTDQAKLNSFVSKWGNILRPSQEEIDIVRQANLGLVNTLFGL